MNINIAKVAKKAGFTIDGMGLASDGINHGIDLNHFAELLIKECMNYACIDEDNINSISKHFEVEE
jgi:hypothetical protein